MPQPHRVFDAAAVAADRRDPRNSGRRAVDGPLAERLEAAMQEGVAQGMALGAEKVRAEVEGLLCGLAEARRGLLAERAAMLESVVAGAARLSVKIAEKILGEKIATDPAALLALVRSALAPLGKCGAVEIRLNDVDAGRCDPAALAAVASEGISIVPDAAVPPGGCTIKTDWGEVSAGAADQIRRVEEIFAVETSGA